MPSTVRVVKADLGGDLRRVPCDSPSFGALMGKLAEAYGYPAGQLLARYVDDESDLVTVGNDADLAMVWQVLGEGKSLLKLSLTKKTGATPGVDPWARRATGATAPAAAPAAKLLTAPGPETAAPAAVGSGVSTVEPAAAEGVVAPFAATSLLRDVLPEPQQNWCRVRKIFLERPCIFPRLLQ
eukprot:SAG22_NODE_18_length_32591_cov_38.043549_18_plen_183_part_00